MHSPTQLEEHFAAGADAPFRRFADAMPCIVLTAVAGGDIDYLNARWRELTGSREDAPGLEAWLSGVHVEDRSKFIESWQVSIEAQKSFALEFRLWSQESNEHRWQILHVRPHRNRAGEILRWIGTCEDIHERKAAEELLRKSEARLRTLIEESPVGVVVLNPEGQPVYFNRKCVELRGKEVDVSTWSSVLHPDERDQIVESWMQSLAKGLPWNAIYRFVHPDGQMVWVSARTVPIRSQTELLGFVRTLEDITELKTAEENLRAANQELQSHASRLESEVEERTTKLREALAELDKLSYSIVHDMRAPLRTMQGFAKVLLQEHAARLNEEGQQYLRLIASAAQRQDKLIQDVLVYHHYVRNEFELAPVNLDELVSGILATYANLQPPRVRVEVRKPLGWVLAHETLLTQCISALLDNAVKFVAPDVKPAVIVGTEKTPTETRLWVQDNGIGIAPDCRDKLFDIFYKFHHPAEYPGTGIGLPLARKAVERMQGRIGVESEVGKGSRFWIALKPMPAR